VLAILVHEPFSEWGREREKETEKGGSRIENEKCLQDGELLRKMREVGEEGKREEERERSFFSFFIYILFYF